LNPGALALVAGLVLAGCALAPWPREDDFARVRDGMTEEEVRRAVGAPYAVESFTRLHQVAWDYRLFDNFGYFALISIIFDEQGRVVSRVHRRFESESND